MPGLVSGSRGICWANPVTEFLSGSLVVSPEAWIPATSRSRVQHPIAKSRMLCFGRWREIKTKAHDGSGSAWTRCCRMVDDAGIAGVVGVPANFLKTGVGVMAGIAKHGKGHRVFWRETMPHNPDGPSVVRQTIFVAGSRKVAETVRGHIEELLAARDAGLAPPAGTVAWCAALPDGSTIRSSLEKFGLVRRSDRNRALIGMTLVEAMKHVIALKSPTWGQDAKTGECWEQSRKWVEKYFGRRLLVSITPSDVAQWRAWMGSPKVPGGRPLKPTSSGSHVKKLKAVFAWAVGEGVIESNPAADEVVPCEVAENQYIELDDFNRVLDQVTSLEWRVLLLMARFCGLRVPSEIKSMEWSDITFAGAGERSSILVRSSKTAHIGKGTRLCPLFPEVQADLRALFDDPKGSRRWVFGRLRDNSNPSTQLHRFCARAGVQPWDRPFVSLRASAATDLAAKGISEHLRTQWLGHTPKVALRHYLKQRDRDWDLALGVTPSGTSQGTFLTN